MVFRCAECEYANRIGPCPPGENQLFNIFQPYSSSAKFCVLRQPGAWQTPKSNKTCRIENRPTHISRYWPFRFLKFPRARAFRKNARRRSRRHHDDATAIDFERREGELAIRGRQSAAHRSPRHRLRRSSMPVSQIRQKLAGADLDT